MMMKNAHFVVFLLAAVNVQLTVADSALSNLPQAIYTRSRRFLNLGSLFGSATQSKNPYDRIAGQPVFAVTTPWGSPYMNMEKLSDLEEVVPLDNGISKRRDMDSTMDETKEYRTVVLYFMDQDDALGVHGEMKQMEQMADADLRITSFSFAKALRQAANLGNGLPTGSPMDDLTGNLKPPQEGGSLRYKIVPSKRQLYYAARCVGRERVGLMAETNADDAVTAIQGRFEAVNLERRRIKKERKTGERKKSPMQLANLHMEGHLGIPVFYNPAMKRVPPLIKRIVSGSQQEAPLFLNYEDMMDAWNTMRQRHSKQSIPEEPPRVEVFNLWDVLTSMDRASFREKQQPKTLLEKVLSPIRERIPSSQKGDVLQMKHLTFVPSSRSVEYKEAITARGNGKARLPRMR